MPKLLSLAEKIIEKSLFDSKSLKTIDKLKPPIKTAPNPYNPSRSLPTKSRNSLLKDALGTYSDDVVNVSLATITTAKTGALAIDQYNKELADTKKTENDALKEPFAFSPLLKNQIELKVSIDELISAIHSQTTASVAMFATFDNNLKTVGSTLMAISSTLIDISDNYSSQIEKADDLPFIDAKTFYKMMEDKGLPFDTSFNLQSQELEIMRSMEASGSTYSDIKSALTQFRKSSIPSDYWFGVSGDLAGVTSPSPLNPDGSVSPTQSSLDLTKLNEWADSAKEHLEFQKTPLMAPDTSTETGTLEMSPREAKHASAVQNARHKQDTNDQDFDDDDFNNPFDVIPTIPFISSSDIYNPNHQAPTSNSFLEIMKTKFTGLFS